MRYSVTYLIYIAVIARAIGWSWDTARIPIIIWILLAVYGIFLFSERYLTRRFSSYPRVYILVQAGVVISMLYCAPTLDFLTMLFYSLSFQAVQFFRVPVGFLCIAAFSLAMAGMFFFGLEWQAGVTMILTASGVNALMGSFAHLIARTETRRQENQRLFAGLQDAYHKLKNSAAQAEALAAAEERHHLARELHDSLTQTLFSMNLASQSAQLILEENPSTTREHLVRLQTLARSAAAEVKALIGQASPVPPAQGTLASAIQDLAAQRLAQDGLSVSVEIKGERVLPAVVEANLYRIAQEALNNISRHAGVNQAAVRLLLESPLASLEIEDKGCGFPSGRMKPVDGFGLSSMAERASEVGWEFRIDSRPGHGTLIRAEEKPG